MKRLFSFIALMFIAVSGLMAQNPMMEPIPLDPAIRTGVLPNGLKYFIMHNEKPEGQAEFFIVHNVGAIQEEDTQQGLAHFLEHMAFNGTENFPGKSLLEWSESIGVKFGRNINAFTSYDLTAYTLSSVPLVRESIIDSALLILHDWSHFISLVPEEIDNERGVIVEERRTGNTAARRIMDSTREFIHFDTKYKDRNVIGHEDFLKTFDHQELRDFYYRWYRPDLQAVIVVGDFDVDMMEQKVIAAMSDIPAVQNPEEKQLYPITSFDGTKVGIFSDPELTHTAVEVYFRSESLPQEYNNTMLANTINVLDHFVGAIANERLTDISRKKGAPFISANTGASGYLQPAKVQVFMAYSEEGKSLTALEALMMEIEKINRFGFTEAEFDRAKTKILRGMEQQYDNRNDRRSQTLAYRLMDVFTENQIMPSPETEWQIDSTIVENLNFVTVSSYIRELLTEDNRFVIVKSPVKEGVEIPTEAQVREVLDRVEGMELEAAVDNTVKEPLIQNLAALKGSKVKKTSSDIHGSTIWTLANGVKVVLMPTDHKADQILMNAKSGGGLSIMGDEDVLAANLYGFYAQRAGVDRFSGNELQKQLAGKNVNMSPYIGQYSHGISANSSVKDIETMFQLIYLYLTSPRDSEEDFDVMMNTLLTSYKNMSTNPDFVFGVEFFRTAYNDNVRRNQPTYESLQAIEFEQMAKVYNQLFTNPDDLTFTFVGKFDLETIKPLIVKYLGSLPKTKKSIDWVDDGVRTITGRVETIVETPMETPKTKVACMFSGDIEYNVENEVVMDALTAILQMRYLTTIREERGAAYSVGVMGGIENRPIQNYGIFVIFDTNNEMVEEALGLVAYDLERISNEGVTAEELAKHKEYSVKEFADDQKNNSFWLGHIVEYNVDGYDTFTGYEKALENLSSDDIKALAAQIIADGNILTFLLNPEETKTTAPAEEL